MPILAAETAADFVDLDVAPWQWLALLLLIGVLLAVDLIAHRGDHVPTARRALVESAIWVACGLGFGAVVLASWGGEAFGEYLSGYVIEKSLGVDNVFVWAIIFSSFAIPLRYQHRVLFWGIFGALTLRAAFILGGSALIQQFSWVLVIFGAVLVVSGIKVVRHRDDEGTHGHDRAVRLLSRVMPMQRELAGHHFVVRNAGKWVATPLLATLVVVEVSDIVFAVDSVPAILAVYARAVHRLRVEHVRDPRLARDVLLARGCEAALPLPVARARCDPRAGRDQDADLALVPRVDPAVARGDRPGARGSDRLQPAA